MKTVLVRLVSGFVGVIAAGIALWIPLLFAVMEINELHSYDGPISIRGAIGGCSLVLAISAAFGFGGYKLLKLAAGR
jgi:hypothetical protein